MKHIEVVNQNQHLQGFTLGNGHMYWSFTDSIVMTTTEGTVRRQNLIFGGHLGDIEYYDGKVYGSYLKNSLPGHAWEDWTGFMIYVFDADDLSVIDVINLDICDEYKRISCLPEDTRGFQGIDGVTFAPDPVSGEIRMFVACALYSEERFSNQIILSFTPNGEFKGEYHIPTGNTVYGIQNLNYDWDSGDFWFTTYGSSHTFSPRETLFRVSLDGSIKAKYAFSTPYGFFCLGGNRFLCSLQGGVNGKRFGTAYECDESFFGVSKSEEEIGEYIAGFLD